MGAFGNTATWFANTIGFLPSGWFDPNGPVITAVANGIATAFAAAACDLSYVSDQSRISSATGMFLDLCAVDFLGFGNLPVCIAKTQYSNSADPEAFGIIRVRAANGR